MVFWNSIAVTILLSRLAGALPSPQGADINPKPEIPINTVKKADYTVQSVVKPTETILVKPNVANNIQLERDGHSYLQPFPPFPIIGNGKVELSDPFPINDTITLPGGVVINTNKAGFGESARFDIFAPIATNDPPFMFERRAQHPVRKGTNDQGPIQTNKFWTNMMIEKRTQPVWTQPYVMKFQNRNTQTNTVGMSISHAGPEQRVFGPDRNRVPVQYYIVPSNMEDIILSADQIRNGGAITLTETGETFAKAVITANPGYSGKLEFPMCQGMGFVTGLYTNLTPVLNSGAAFLSIAVSEGPKTGLKKFKITLNDGKTWLVYATATAPGGFNNPTYNGLILNIINQGLISGNAPFNGMLQVARLMPGAGPNIEALYDAAAGAFCAGNGVTAQVSGNQGSYSYNFRNGGVADTELLMFGFPHHKDSIDCQPTALTMQSTTKGKMTAYVGNRWTLRETLQPDIGFDPWRTDGKQASFSAATVNRIRAAAQVDITGNFDGDSNLDSMYFAGKALTRQAQLCWVAKDVIRDANLVNTCLTKLKASFGRFAMNKQITPLVYDQYWGGVVSSAGYSDPGRDFGNTNYNDHHFHFGYHVYAGAVLAYLDPSWLKQDNNRAYVTTLIRDFANPSTQDRFFPRFRAFDWFAGHSWAKGVFESADGKDQESTSEDYFATYAMKLWGNVVGDAAMAARATLMLAIQKRTIPRYFLIAPDNDIHPPEFVANMVTGILFEGKVDYTTYFGTNKEYIHGIQMIPLSPVTNYIRPAAFVRAEYEKYFQAPVATRSWQALIKGNSAVFDPRGAWNYISNPGFDMGELDGGASLTWYLTWIGGIGGADGY